LKEAWGVVKQRDAVLLIMILIISLVGMTYFDPFTPDYVGNDGFKVQIDYILRLIDSNVLVDAMASNGLITVHAFRTLAISPFLIVENYIGSFGSLVLLGLVVLPLVRAISPHINVLLAGLPLLLPLAISGRSVLVAAGIGYLVMYLMRHTRKISVLVIGILFCNLSSASVFSAAALLLFWWPYGLGYGALGWRFITIMPIILSGVASYNEKIWGFTVGAAGYQAHAFTVGGDNALLSALSRSTLLVSFAEGQYLRAIVYLLLACYVMYKVVSLTIQPGRRYIQILLLCCVPGIFMEGQGVLAMFFPVFWLLVGALTPPPGRLMQVQSQRDGLRPFPRLPLAASRIEGAANAFKLSKSGGDARIDMFQERP
jgi:hypothetical protein